MRTKEPPGMAQDAINGRLYQRAGLVRQYESITLHPPEVVALVRYHGDILNCRILDLGCGAGRLAAYLRPLTEHYVGLDISRHMVAHCQRTYPGLRFFQGDMRSLTRFADGSFDTVLAVFNLLDTVAHPDRLRVLAEIGRVLAPGGLLVFSAHNRNYAHAADPPRLVRSRNPLTQLRLVADYVRATMNHRRVKPQERLAPEFALLNDSAHDHSTLHYYITRQAQARQLAGAGFTLLECLDESGRTLDPGADDATSPSIHYVARSGGD